MAETNVYGWEKRKTDGGILYIREYASGTFRFVEYTVDEEDNELMLFTAEFEINTFDEFFPRGANAVQRMEKAFQVVNENGPGYFHNGTGLGKPSAEAFDLLHEKLTNYGI